MHYKKADVIRYVLNMSIRELLMNMPSVTNSNVLLAPTKEMPIILSQRYQKNGSNSKFLAPTSQNDFPDSNPVLTPSTRRKRISAPRIDSRSSIDQPKSKVPEEKIEPTGPNATEQKELEYAPFKLKATSSFNPRKLTSRQLKRLDPLTLAKYEAYSVPNTEILGKVLESECRAKTFITEERRKFKAREEESRKKWNIIHCGYEDQSSQKLGEKNAQKARERMKSKLHQMLSHRVCLMH